MNCQNAEHMIMPYINGTLEDNQKEQFLKHVITCNSCYDEFEIYYTLLVVLQKMKEEPDGSYDMKSILEKAIDDELNLIYRKKLCSTLRKAVFFLAEICILLVVLFGLGIWSM